MRSFIPDLILPPEVVPTETQRDRLCSCVLVRLDPSDVDALERLNPNGRTWARQDSVPDNLMASLREAVTRCGGESQETLPDVVFYSSRASLAQDVPLSNASRVRIAFSCASLTVTRDQEPDSIKLEIDGTYSIEGFHGSREHAGATPLAPESLRFEVSGADGMYKLVSAERSFLHHSLLVDQLHVRAPFDLPLEVECVLPGKKQTLDTHQLAY